MFSYEDRLRAVQLYIKLDKRIGLTIRQLGGIARRGIYDLHVDRRGQGQEEQRPHGQQALRRDVRALPDRRRLQAQIATAATSAIWWSVAPRSP